MKKFKLVAIILIGLLSLLSLVRLVYHPCSAKSPFDLSIGSHMIHRGSIISESELASLKDSWANSSESVGFASIHPSPEGAAAAEREFIPNRIVHLPPYEMGLNQYGKVIFVGIADGAESRNHPASSDFTGFDWLGLVAHLAAFIGCIVLILSCAIRTRRKSVQDLTSFVEH